MKRTVEQLVFNRVSHPYESYAEAVAYLDGIRFVNDSALKDVGIRETKDGRYEVLMWDADSLNDFKAQSIKRADLLLETRSRRG